MQIHCDAPGSERSHGYTDDGEYIHYWVYDHVEAEVSFRTAGTPSDYPGVSEDVRDATEEWIEDQLDENGLGIVGPNGGDQT